MLYFNRLSILSLVGLVSLVFPAYVLAVPQGLIDGLSNESYALREHSERELAKWAEEKGGDSLVKLGDLKRRAQSPEVKSRLDNVISGITGYKAIPGTRGFIGIMMDPVLGAISIKVVNANTPAEKVGLQINDRIIELDGVDLSKKNRHLTEAMDFLRVYVQGKKAGEKLTMKILRDGEVITKVLKLADYNKMVGIQDPFGNGFNGGNLVLPMRGGFQGQVEIIPRPMQLNPRQLKENEIEVLELQMMQLKKFLDNDKLPKDAKDVLGQEAEKSLKRLEELRKELKNEKALQAK